MGNKEEYKFKSVRIARFFLFVSFTQSPRDVSPPNHFSILAYSHQASHKQIAFNEHRCPSDPSSSHPERTSGDLKL